MLFPHKMSQLEISKLKHLPINPLRAAVAGFPCYTVCCPKSISTRNDKELLFGGVLELGKALLHDRLGAVGRAHIASEPGPDRNRGGEN